MKNINQVKKLNNSKSQDQSGEREDLQYPNDLHKPEGLQPPDDQPLAEGATSDPETDLLRFTTAGSVDDGKSTLIGRLLFDSKSIFEDQLDALQTYSKAENDGSVNLALLTDGLRAEREQGITIDVAYRYFATPKRKFIIADTPGHEQYTRNMVTGASTADLAVILIDARKGVLTQSRRHAYISSLLQIPNLVVAINKMDLTEYRESRFREIVDDFKSFARHLDVSNITFIPISALQGDNIVNKSDHMPWYEGPTLLSHLESVNVSYRKNLQNFRFPVQFVIRPNQDFRGYAGRVVSGSISRGDDVLILPANERTKIRSILTPENPVETAVAGESVVLQTDQEIDISRGDMIVRVDDAPVSTTKLEATVCWMNRIPLQPGKSYELMHTTRTTRAVVSSISYRFDVDSLQQEPSDELGLNEIGRVTFETAHPLFVDPYHINGDTGSFILIDPDSNVTAGAGMILEHTETPEHSPEKLHPGNVPEPANKENVFWEELNISRQKREQKNGHKAGVIWFTGVSGAGKTTIARALENKLWDSGHQTMHLDGDQLRHGLNSDLGFSPSDRRENIRRVGEVARLFFEQGNIVLCSFVSPYQSDRKAVRELFPDDRFLEVHVHCQPETRIRRDPKGLYRKAKLGQITSLTGFDSEYEAPGDEAVSIDTDQIKVEEAVAGLASHLHIYHIYE